MPVVKAFVGLLAGGFGDADMRDEQHHEVAVELLDMLNRACHEIVPAAMHSVQGPLWPGSIQFVGDRHSAMSLPTDVFVEVEILDLKDRRNIGKRAEAIRAALSELFPSLTFSVWAKLVPAGYATDATRHHPNFDGDMSMEAAIARAKRRMAGPTDEDVAEVARRVRQALTDK